MKKILTLAIMAMVALTATTLISCGDDDNNNGGSNDPVSTDESCSMKLAFSDDFLELFDVTATRKSGTSSVPYSFTTATTLQKTNTKGEVLWSCTGKVMTESFTVPASTTVSVSVSATLKSNWQEIIKSKTSLNLAYQYAYVQGSVTSQNASIVSCTSEESVSKLTAEQLKTIAEGFSSMTSK